ncbi:hypothetical protein DAPPUDRAFT_320438 [Daphnia pulex]|uniref:BZIP domain-containing protein n=1 Tax=Daphnia pulex TaxID=6669 RepID=E9GPU6_DAPPU|nr:hypothetical protein DAPPUDRAFT_320438 [Daphnia pulex]|eukprot:EFX78524.1 hypothetical protein DAPPUDRAFT_320438 [Daphnia pulex]
MEDVEMASIGGKKLSHMQRKMLKYTPEQMEEWRRQRCNRNKSNKFRKQKTQEIEMLKAFDSKLLNAGKQRLAEGKAKKNLAKEVAVAEAIPHAPNPTQQLENEKEELLNDGRKNPAAAKNKVVAAPSGTKR